jgi:hypothetical protein
MAVAFGMMIVIRPTNCLVGFFFFFWDASDRKEIMSRLRLIVLPEYLLPLIGIAFLFFLPQMIFWKLEYGSFIHLKYGENFSNWNHPKFLEVWFSTLNGLVPWSPLILFFIAGIFFMIIKRIRNGIPVLFLFLLVSYMAAAYKYWYYGCGYGHRAFVEFYPVLCIPFGYLSEQLFSRPGKILKIIFSFFILLMIYVNMGMSLFGDKCFFGSTWDWDQYSRQLMRIHLYPEPGRFIFINDFENAALYNYSGVTDAVKYSGTWSAVLDAGREYCCEHPAMIRDFKGKYPIFVTTRLFVKKVNPGPIGALLVCSFEKDSTKYGWQIQPLDPFVRDTVSWFCVFKTFRVPAGLNGDTVIKIYIWNKNRCAFFVDDLRITYK